MVRNRCRGVKEIRVKILGINFGHDASLAYLVDGKLVAFEEIERHTRLKHHFGIKAEYVEAFLNHSGIEFADVDFVAICSTQGWRMRHCDAIKMSEGWGDLESRPILRELGFWPEPALLQGFDGMDRYDALARAEGMNCSTPSVFNKGYEWRYLDGPTVVDSCLATLLSEVSELGELAIKERPKSFATPFRFRMRNSEKPGFYADHHACHAYYSYFYSGSQSSIICTHDGGAPIYPFNSGGIYLSDHAKGVIPLVSHNLGLGLIYDQVAAAIGLENEPGKLMGLASYASPSPKVFSLVETAIKAFSLKQWEEIKNISREILAISENDISLRRASTERFKFALPNWQTAIQAAANAQLFVQSIFVTVIGRILTEIAQVRADLKTVDLTGGFTFNCPSNFMLQQQFPSFRVNPLPGAGDTGLPIGAAALVCELLGTKVHRSVHSDGLIAAFPPTNRKGGAEEPIGPLEKVAVGLKSIPEFIAESIAEGKVLCLHRGRSEVGPRALGHRSIIAPATSDAVRDRINASKGRELWRPLAPICREEDFHDYFDGDPKLARYMLFTFRVLGQHLPAVSHVDGTARVQCITATDDWLHPALGILKHRKHHPVIINTSFNYAGEPMVETFAQAVFSFLKMGFDFLVTDKGVFAPSPLGEK